MIYKYELWDSYPLEGDWKGIQINEVPANIVINDWVNGNILLSDYCLKMLVVELQDEWNNKLLNLQENCKINAELANRYRSFVSLM